MNNLTLNLIDAENEIHKAVHGSFADAVIASLSAEPETLAELRVALTRFRDCRDTDLSGWRSGISEAAGGAGICFVDLPARLVVCRSSHASPRSQGAVRYQDARSGAKVQLWFRLSDDWEFAEDVERWRELSSACRRQRHDAPTCRGRIVLYEELPGFLVSECVAAAAKIRLPVTTASSSGAQEAGWSNVLSEIHARWLMMPRPDLAQRSPRDVLLAKHELVEFDLQSRRDQWSLLDECPPGLSADSKAYREAGFGTHEIVLYYDLVRHLLWDCWTRVSGRSAVDFARETSRLNQMKQEWLHTACDITLEGLTPSEVIESERRRVPLVVSGGQALVDCDCPLCQMMAESGPVFLHLDGCHMEEDFAFSFHLTREQWEAEQLEWDAAAAEWNCERQDPGSGQEGDPAGAAPAAEKPEYLLIAVAACLADLGLDLRESTESALLVPALNRHFGNLREVARDGSSELLEPVVERMVEELQEVLDCRPELTDKCTDLVTRLDHLVNRIREETAG